MKSRTLGTIALLYLVGAACAVQAEVIVDTGLGDRTGNRHGMVVSTDYWQAARFSTTRPYVIDSVQGWFLPVLYQPPPGTLHLSIYGSAGDVPDPTQRAYSCSFAIPLQADSPYLADSTIGDGWFGPNGLNLALPAGTYWASFEVWAGDTYWGSLCWPSPNPLSAYSTYVVSDDNWSTYWANNHTALRITGSAVPEPSAITALLAGLAGVGGFAFRRRS